VRKLSYVSLDNKRDLETWFDDLCESARAMVRRTGGHGATAEGIIKTMFTMIGRNDYYLLICVDAETHEFLGFLHAILTTYDVPYWVDFLALYTKPGVAKQAKNEVFEMLCAWARSMGAVRIMTTVTRSPLRFYKWFHKPLGFTFAGVLLEVKI